MKNIIFVLLSFSLFMSCAEKSQKEVLQKNIPVSEEAIDTMEMISDQEANVETYTVNARFVEFVLGDAEHYKFEDESGKMWDFSGCETVNFDFTRELDENEADESNQGWGSNKSLQGKWFMLTYYKNEQPQYIDGPMVWANIINEAVLQEN